MDVIQRLEPVIIEIERERECVCVVAHQAILRALYGYFMKIPLAVSRPAATPIKTSTLLRVLAAAPDRHAASTDCICNNPRQVA